VKKVKILMVAISTAIIVSGCVSFPNNSVEKNMDNVENAIVKNE